MHGLTITIDILWIDHQKMIFNVLAILVPVFIYLSESKFLIFVKSQYLKTGLCLY